MDKDLFTVADSETIDIIDKAIDDLRGLGATIIDPGPHGALFQGCVDKLLPVVDNKLFTRQWPDLFPVDAAGNPTADHIPLLINMFEDPSLVPHQANGQPNIRSFGTAANVGTARFKMDLYLRERGDANIQSTADLISKSTFFNDIRYTDKRAGLVTSNNAMTLDNVNDLARHYTLQMVTLQCFGQLNLDAVVFPSNNIPASKLGAPTEPTKNDRSFCRGTSCPARAASR